MYLNNDFKINRYNIYYATLIVSETFPYKLTFSTTPYTG